LLFPRLGRDRARAGIRQCLSLLRRALGNDFIRSDGEAVWLETGRSVWIDALEASRQGKTREGLERAERLFRGEFLAGFFLRDAPGFDAWQRSREESIRADHVGILRDLAEIHLEAREPEEAVDCARRWLELDPTDEAGHRALMQSYALGGSRAEALRQYERCRQILSTELGAVPDGETEKLRDRIAQGELARRAAGPAALREPEAPPNNLQAPSTAFIGRESELKEVAEFLGGREVRRLTITGSAGTGKTRIAREAARLLLPDFPHGAFFVDLAPLREPSQVLPTIAGAIGVEEMQGSNSAPFDLVRDHVRDKRLLLVLDNFEHLLDAADPVARLLAECPRLTVLATSREPLRLQAEHEYLLAPLPPDEAVRLFVDRARAARRDFALTEENEEAVARICSRLDGLPLAIELAAGRTRFLPPEKLLSQLETQGSGQLRGGAKDMPSRHRTLRAAIEWSHDLLTAPEKELFRQLAVFRGGFTLEGVEHTCTKDDGEDILATFESLVEKNLVHRTAAAGEPSYAMLETIREFAEQRLEECGEADRVRQQHARYYLEMAEKAEPELDQAAGARWALLLEAEYANLRAAMEWGADHDLETALRIAAALARFLAIRFLWLEQSDLWPRLLSKGRTSSAAGLERWRAKALAALSNSVLTPWSARMSIAAAEESVSLWRTVGDASGLGNGLLLVALARSFEARDPHPILALLEESAASLRESGDAMGLSHTMFYQAYFTHIAGDAGKAKTMAGEAQQAARTAGDVMRAAGANCLLGLIALEEGDDGLAQSLAEKGLALFRETKDKVGLFLSLSSLGGIALLRGNMKLAGATYREAFDLNWGYAKLLGKVCVGLLLLREEHLDQALASFKEGIDLLRPMDSRWSAQCLCACLAGVADVRAARGSREEAAAILGGVESTLLEPYARLAWGYDFTVTPTVIRVEFDRIRQRLNRTLGDRAAAALDAGRGLPLEKLIGIALGRT